jgi:D-alanine-D-alanine ligase
MKILIITGGNSSERTVSLTSAKTVEEALRKNGHDVKLYDLTQRYEGIIREAENFDILFPVLHGEEGEGGILHEFLAKINKPIVGTRNYEGLKDAWHKIPFKEYCDENGIKTPDWKIIKNADGIIEFDFPCVLKASNGGSSREVAILESKSDLDKPATLEILNLETPLFVEKYIKGVEITVGILNGKILPFLEIIPPNDSWFNYENKYDGTSQEIPFAPSVSKETQQEVKEIFLKIQDHFNLGTYFIADFIIANEIPYVLDINTIPGLTPGSLFPKQALAAGLNFGKMLEVLINSAK